MMDIEHKTELTEAVAELTTQFLFDLAAASGAPADCILAGAQSAVVAAMAATLGADLAAAACRRAAERLEFHAANPVLAALEFGPVAGRA